MKVFKFLLAFLVVVVALYGASSWYTGREAQSLIEHELAQANEQVLKAMGPETGVQDVQIRIRSYDRGVFTSQAEYEMQWREEDGGVVSYVFTDNLQHGPFPLAALQQGHWAPGLAFSEARLQKTESTESWVNSLDGASPVVVRTFVGFGGTGVSNWIFREANFSEADGSKVVFSGGQVDIRFSDHFQSHVASGGFDKLEMTDVYGSVMALDAISLESENVLSQSGERTLDSVVKVERIGLIEPEMQDIVLSRTQVALQATQADELLTGQISYGADAVEFGGAPLGSIVAQVSADQLNMTALTKLVQEYDAMQLEDAGTEEGLPQLDDDQARRLRAGLFEFLGNQPALTLGPVVWTNSQGQARIQLDADFIEPDQALLDAPADQLLLAVLGRLHLDAEIEKPFFEELFIQLSDEERQRASAMARMVFDLYAGRLSRAGLAVYENNTLKMNASYEEDTIRLNGEMVGLTEFLQRLFQGVL
ncbi:YdgA family protein [Neopusillimonas maritima]|uniref:DUF945 domain-containing protein n=1 Tax=Neopusillimonas maritima TaxID=2026239 RepID=A0A3A1YRV6_9BURK|nr:YdgA family protein [Neopusillimonas maritima]RIY40942.1 hypothetical protein CJP73_09130 [Neopusillimonas maritima]